MPAQGLGGLENSQKKKKGGGGETIFLFISWFGGILSKNNQLLKYTLG